MRVLQLTSSFPRYEGDASGLFIGDVTATLAASAGLEVHVVAPHDAGALAREVVEGVAVRRFRYAWPMSAQVLAHRGGILANLRHPARAALVPGFLASYLAAGLAEARRVRPDVVHAHWWFPGGAIGAAVARAIDVPLVVTLHGSDVHLAERGRLAGLARRVLARAEIVATVSEALRDVALAELGVAPERARVLPMPVCMGSAVRASSPPLPASPLRLVAIGRLSPEKGFDVAIAALARLVPEGLAATLEVFGDGPERRALEAQATSALGPGVVSFHGARPRSVLAEALGRAHALVAPSRREGLGMVALEALSVGVPVVASRVGGLVETVVDGHDGLLVAPADAGALADALRKLPLPPPRASALARHLPLAVAAAHLAAYNDAVALKRASR